MTLCIAALCASFRGPAVVTSADMRIESKDYVGAEIGWKYVELTDEWTAMLAGSIAEARELAGHYRTMLLEQQGSLTEENAVKRLHEPLHAMRLDLADRCTQRRAAMPYKRFLHEGREKLSESWYAAIADEIDQQRVRAQLILIGWIGDKFVLYTVDGTVYDTHGTDSAVRRDDDFATIGTGAYVALANLYHREQMSILDLPRTLYNVYESHALARKTPGVGKANAVRVLEHTPLRRVSSYLGPHDRAEYERYFEKYGPQDPSEAVMPMGFSQHIDQKWLANSKAGEPPSDEAQDENNAP